MSHILIVTNDDLFCEMLRLIFVQFRPSFRLATATNSQRAYIHYHQNSTDLILADDQMPMMTGSSLIQALRAEHVTTPVVLLSRRRETRLAMAHDDYTVLVAKPIHITDLLAVVDMLLATS